MADRLVKTSSVLGGCLGHAWNVALVVVMVWSALTTEIAVLRVLTWVAAAVFTLMFVYSAATFGAIAREHVTVRVRGDADAS